MVLSLVSTIVAKKSDVWVAVLSTLSAHVARYWGRDYSLCPRYLMLFTTQPLCLKSHMVINLELTPSLTAACQSDLSVADNSQLSTSMLHCFKLCFSVSLKSFFWSPCVQLPTFISPYSNCFGILVSSILNTRPAQHNCDVMSNPCRMAAFQNLVIANFILPFDVEYGTQML